MEWFKKHSDTLLIMGMILIGFKWADSKFDRVQDQMIEMRKDISSIDRDLQQVKTWLFMHGWQAVAMKEEN